MLDSILTPFVFIPLSTCVMLTLGGFLIRQSLLFVAQNWVVGYHHLVTYLLLPNIAFVITTVIANNIALSLGMIGALSIVRFRNPVKSPFELVMFFALVTLGVTAGVSIGLCQNLFFLIVFVLLGIKIFDIFLKKFFNLSLFQYSFGDGNITFSLDVETSKDLKILSEHKGLISSFNDKKNNVYNFRLVFKNRNELIKFKNELTKIENINNIRSDLQS